MTRVSQAAALTLQCWARGIHAKKVSNSIRDRQEMEARARMKLIAGPDFLRITSTPKSLSLNIAALILLTCNQLLKTKSIPAPSTLPSLRSPPPVTKSPPSHITELVSVFSWENGYMGDVNQPATRFCPNQSSFDDKQSLFEIEQMPLLYPFNFTSAALADSTLSTSSEDAVTFINMGRIITAHRFSFGQVLSSYPFNSTSASIEDSTLSTTSEVSAKSQPFTNIGKNITLHRLSFGEDETNHQVAAGISFVFSDLTSLLESDEADQVHRNKMQALGISGRAPVEILEAKDYRRISTSLADALLGSFRFVDE